MSTAPGLAGAALLLALWAACGSARNTENTGSAAVPAHIEVPVRATTAGDALMALAPGGADGVLEVDLARLRANPTVGPAMEHLLALPEARDLDAQLLRSTEVLLLCSYAMGQDEASTLTLARGPGVAALGKGEPIDEHTVALGPPALIERVRAVQQGKAGPLTADRALMAVRAAAMPERAEGAALRVAARLSFEARVSLASRFELEQVPVSVSVWGDVADDLAVVATLDSSTQQDAAQLSQALMRWRDQVAGQLWMRALSLDVAVRGTAITTHGRLVRAVFLIGPSRLARLVERVRAGAREP